jgi:hypothetical protein
MAKKFLLTGRTLMGLVAIPGLVLAQAAQENRTLVVNGQLGQAPVIQVQGKSYVEVEALARVTNGSLSFRGSQITLTLPASSATAPTPLPTSSDPVSTLLSKDFSKAGIEALAVIREWRTALVNAVRDGMPVTEDSDAGYRAQAAKDLRLASVEVSTDSDRNAYQLLSNEVTSMQKFSNEITTAHDNLQNISPDALKEDPLEQQTLNCGRSLASALASGQFQDDGSCH